MATTLYPTIDILHGRCVLPRRDEDATEWTEAFEGDPVEVARRWRDAGAAWLHVADLDGALAGEPRHLDLLRAVAEATALPIQTGGGLRSEAAVEAAFAAGAERVVLGTAALRDPELLAICLNRWGRRIAVSVDSRGGKVVLAGWLQSVAESAVEFAGRMADAGVRTLVMTNVERDGTLAGTDLPALCAARAALPNAELIAAGRVASLDDVRALAALGVDGVMLGRALYDGTLDLADALRVARETPPAPPAAEAPSGPFAPAKAAAASADSPAEPPPSRADGAGDDGATIE